MAISTVIEKLGRAIFEAPFGGTRISKDAPELAEIRLAVLDAVKAKSHRSSGKSVFPHNVVRIELLGVPEDQAHVFESDFLSNYLAGELRTSLKRSGYRFPDDLRVEIITTPRLPEEKENWLAVETSLEQRKSEQHTGHLQPAKLFVLSGTANQKELLLSKARTNIGRTSEVFRQEGPSRRNDLAFTEENDINRTVSREHAHILYSQKSGEYRIFNDRWYKGQSNCGIWIVRDGMSQPVHRSARGTLLQAGDEIHLGNAVLRFDAAGD
jgi:hypothetical protein